MNCDEVRELLLTDYLDGELGEKEKGDVEAHLFTCAGCRALAEETARAAVEPFRRAAGIRPPELMWERIRKLAAEPEKKDRFVPWRHVTRVVFSPVSTIAALVVAVVTAAGLFVLSPESKNAAAPAAGQAMSYLLEEGGSAMSDFRYAEFGSNIEKMLS